MLYTIGWSTFSRNEGTVRGIGCTSAMLDISASIIQGSAIGPVSYVINTGDLATVVQGNRILDPSAAPSPLFRLARTKSGWRAGAPTTIRLAAAGDFRRRRQRNSARPRERRHITLLVSLSMEHVVSTASVVTVGYFGAH